MFVNRPRIILVLICDILQKFWASSWNSVGCPLTALYFTLSASFPVWAPNLSEARPGRPVKDLNVLLPQLLPPIILPCGYYYQIQYGFGKKLFQLVLWQEKCLFREALKVVTCYLLSNLETANFGCFLDSAGILDYVFRKLNSVLYTWRICFQWKTAVEKKNWKQCCCWYGNRTFDRICFLFLPCSNSEISVEMSREEWQCGWILSE